MHARIANVSWCVAGSETLTGGRVIQARGDFASSPNMVTYIADNLFRYVTRLEHEAPVKVEKLDILCANETLGW